MTGLIVLAGELTAFLGALLIAYGTVYLLDQVPWVHERIEAWLPERGWWQ